MQLLGDTAVEVSSVGFIARDVFDASIAELSALCAANPRITCVLWTTSELDGYEPGNTAVALKWLARHAQIRRTAVVTRSQAVASLVHIGRVMIPGLETRAFRIRAEACEWFATPFTGRPRTRSGRFKAA
ncbi:MAG: STAS/SEC14 domain-containing protein [Polyangiales bacterium]